MIEKPSISGVRAAAQKVATVVPPTPLVAHRLGDATIWCKCESAQPVGAFKLRGAWHRLTALDAAQRKAGVVAFSSGNHAQGVAWAAARLGISATIVMPSDAPRLKLDGTRALGADVILYDRASEDRLAIATRLADERGAILVPSFDDPWIIEGQGSAGLEAVEQMAELGFDPPDMIVSPCGGGGLAAGLALAIPGARIVIAEPSGWDDMAESLRRGHIVPVGPHPPPTLCDALQTPKVSQMTFDVLNERSATGVSVSEAQTCGAVRYAHSNLAVTLEPGGAVALAAILSGLVVPAERTLVMLSGGNIDPDLFAQIISG